MEEQERDPAAGGALRDSSRASADSAGQLSAAEEAGLREGERRTVTVLFTDMKGFTALSERLDPELMDGLMTRLFSRFAAVVQAFGGSVEKYIGDAMVAVFGYPSLHEDDPARAIEAALAFAEALEAESAAAELEPRSEAEPGQASGPALPPGQLAFRTGIHTGVVATGKRGGHEVVTGHSMAIAARLQAAAPAGGILVSEAVKERSGGAFLFGEGLELLLKGKEEAVLAYPVLGRSPGGFAWETPFVGREAELQTLLTAYLSAMRSGTGGVYVLGEAGIGKTRLCAEFRSRLAALPSWDSPFLVMNPARTGRYPWAAATGILLSFLGPGGAEAGTEAGLGPGGGSPSRAGLATRLGAAEEDEAELAALVWREGSGLGHGRIAALLARVLEGRFAPGPGGWLPVLIVDSAGAMDEESGTFFRAFLATAERRVFVVLIDRLADEGLALAFRASTRLPVESLDDETAASLVRAVEPAAPERSVALIVGRSQGNPLCLEEFAKLLRKNRGAEPADIPDSVQNAILASTEDLPAELRRLLRGLSVLERPFGPAEAERLLELARAPFQGDLAEALSRLEEGRFLAPGAEGRRRFRHSIIREAIHGSLLHHNQRVLHGAAARLYQERQPGWKADIFRHLVRGGLLEEAAAYLVAERPWLSVEEASLIQDLIEGLPAEPLSRRVELHFLKFAVYWNNDQLEGIEPLVAAVGDLAFRARDRHSLARVNQIHMNVFARRFDFESAVHVGRRAVALHRETGDQRAENSSRAQLASCLAALGEVAEAREVLEGMEGERRELREPYYLEGRLGLALLGGDYKEARGWAEALALLQEEESPGEPPWARGFLAALGLEDFDFSAALAWKESCEEACLEPELLLGIQAARALAFARRGRTEESAASLALARESLERCGNRQGATAKTSALARLELALGDPASARALAEPRLAHAIGRADWAGAFELAASLAEAARAQARRGEAEEADFAFFLEEAAFQAARARVKRRGVEARFLYLSCLPSARGELGAGPALLDPEGAPARLERARALLEAELGALGSEEARLALLESSVLGELAALPRDGAKVLAAGRPAAAGARAGV